MISIVAIMNERAITPFRIDIPAQSLTDLAERLARIRWPVLPEEGDWGYGVSLDRVKELVAYWQDGFDWYAQQERLNRFAQFTTVIDDQQIHLLHVRSPEPGAFPLLLTHGWPGSFAEFAEAIGPLTDPRRHGGNPADAFDVVVPSLPGFGFSSPLAQTGWDLDRIARAWAEPQLARTDPAHVVGVHVNALATLPMGEPGETEGLDSDDLVAVEGLRRWNTERSGYAQILSTRPQTLAFALDDSPVGLLVWHLEWFDDYGEHPAAIDADAILTQVSLYWHTRTGGSAGRIYKEAAASWGQAEGRSEIPTAVAVFPGDSTVRTFAERDHKVVRWTRFDRGGHFAALQAPDLLVDDVRAFFRDLR
jgi:pimeloyl-ACP methyl ester carboxylesterase